MLPAIPVAWAAFKASGVFKFLFSKEGLITLVLLALVGSHIWAYQAGKSSERQEWVKKEEKRLKEEKAKQEREERAAATAKTEQAQVVKDLEKKVEEALAKPAQIKVITKEVVKYVTKKADDQCVLTAGFEWMHNAALDSSLAGSPPVDVDQATGLKASEVAATVAENNAECTARGEVIDAWQEWYVRNKAIYEKAVESSK